MTLWSLTLLTLHPCLNFRQRLLGVHGQSLRAQDEGLWIMPCAAVHTLGLVRPLDVVFLDAHDRPIRVCAELRPNRCAWVWRAHSVVELSAGFCQRHTNYAVQITQQCHAIRQRLRHVQMRQKH